MPIQIKRKLPLVAVGLATTRETSKINRFSATAVVGEKTLIEVGEVGATISWRLWQGPAASAIAAKWTAIKLSTSLSSSTPLGSV